MDQRPYYNVNEHIARDERAMSPVIFIYDEYLSDDDYDSVNLGDHAGDICDVLSDNHEVCQGNWLYRHGGKNSTLVVAWEPLPVVPTVGYRKPDPMPDLSNIVPISYEDSLDYGWDANNDGFHVAKNNNIAIRDSVIGHTNAVRGKVGFSSGVHVWVIRWDPNQYGFHPVIGVGTEKSTLSSAVYRPLISDGESYGWHLNALRLVHNLTNNRDPCVLYPDRRFYDNNGRFTPSDEIVVILDMDRGTLGFMCRGVYMGSAFTGLKGKTLYPMASTTYGFAQIQLRHIGSRYLPKSLYESVAERLSEDSLTELKKYFAIP